MMILLHSQYLFRREFDYLFMFADICMSKEVLALYYVNVGNTLQIDKVGWEQKSNLKIGENIARLSLKMRSQKCISCVITSTDEPYLVSILSTL